MPWIILTGLSLGKSVRSLSADQGTGAVPIELHRDQRGHQNWNDPLTNRTHDQLFTEGHAFGAHRVEDAIHQ